MIVKLEFPLPEKIDDYECALNGRVYKEVSLELIQMIIAHGDPGLIAQAKDLVNEHVNPLITRDFMH